MDKYIDEAAYYRARAMEMMAKAQDAPSKATRLAYLNLARAWDRKAASLEQQFQMAGQTETEAAQAAKN